MGDNSDKMYLEFYWGSSDLHSNFTPFFRTLLALVAIFSPFLYFVYWNTCFFLLTRCFYIFFAFIRKTWGYFLVPDMVAGFFSPSNCSLTVFALALYEKSFLFTLHIVLWSFILSPSLLWRAVTTHLCPSLL